jgi:hypothetical protein
MNTRRRFKPTVTGGGGNNGPAFFRGWKQYEEGDYVIGEYLSKYETNFRGAVSNNYRLKVLECNFSAETKDGELYSPEDLEGQTLILNSVGQLNKFMDKVEVGMLVEVEYAGKKPGNDGVMYHQFSVLQAGEKEEESGL